jgi:nicotinamide riboside kinase
MLMINIFAGPGVGKSTLAADVYARIKRRHINAELSREYAKDIVWSDSLSTLKDQVHILGEQHHRQFILQDKCSVAITDSPILLCSIYNTFYTQYKSFDALALEAHHRFDNLNYVLIRPEGEYQGVGRVEDYEKSLRIDQMIIDFLKTNGIDYTPVAHDYAATYIENDVLRCIYTGVK